MAIKGFNNLDQALNVRGAINNATIINSQYNLASISVNADYEINLTAYYELTSNSLLFVNFPAAINGASNARLSIDSGATFKNILDYTGVQAIGSFVENKQVALYYDGTQWIIFNQEDMANKVSTIRGAGSATDDAYPSELAVRTEIDNISTSTLLVRAIVTATDTEFYDADNNLINTVAGANPTSITFDDLVQSGLIDINRDGGKYKILLNGTSEGSFDMYINGDLTTTNYARGRITQDGSALSGANSSAPRIVEGVNQLRDINVEVDMVLSNFQGNKYVISKSQASGVIVLSGVVDRQNVISHYYLNSISNVTELRFSPTTLDIKNGFEISIYKVV